MTNCYRSTGLTYVGFVACVAFKLVYSAGVGMFRFLCELLVQCVGFFYNFNVFLVTIHFVQVSALVG